MTDLRDVVIEDGIPINDMGSHSRIIGPWERMKPGQSFTMRIECPLAVEGEVSRLRRDAFHHGAKISTRLISRAVYGEPCTVRVWRVE